MKIPNFIARETYIKRIEPFMNQRLVKVFTGQRRVGKSYLLFQIMKKIQEENPSASIIYINKEDLAFSTIQNAEDLHHYILEHKSESNKTYVFIDEIQDIENFESALRSLLLREDLDLYCTGSNANLLSGDVAGQLSGRSIEIKVYSLSYLEFLEFLALNDSDESVELYLKYGGLPYLTHLPLNDAVIFEYLKNIYSTIIFRDVINRYAIRNSQFLEQLVVFLSSMTGSLFSAKKISDFLKSQHIKTSPNQVQTYVNQLVNAFLIHRVKRYDIKGKRLFEIGEKYYFENLGIRNALWGYRLEDRGKIMENVIHNHLLFKGYEVTVGGLGSKEIDFIAQKNGEKIYLQVALTINNEKTMQREFGNLLAIKDNYPKMVITMDYFQGNTVEGIVNISLRDFLKDSYVL